MTLIAPRIAAFLQQRLPVERQASPNTCDSYADAFRLLFAYASSCLEIPPSQLQLEHIDAALITNFLSHMETTRKNSAASRNIRLAAEVGIREGALAHAHICKRCRKPSKPIIGLFGYCVLWRRCRQELRYALRQLRKSPGFTSVAIITLALGIGATTAIISVVDTVLLHSAPYARPAELVAITEKGPTTAPGKEDAVSAGDFTDWQAQAPVFAGVAAYQSWEFHTLTGGGGDPDEVWASPVTPNLFQVLGVNPFLGRTFTPDETQAVILSHQYWKQRGKFVLEVHTERVTA